jgi:hypothetical protein
MMNMEALVSWEFRTCFCDAMLKLLPVQAIDMHLRPSRCIIISQAKV